MAHLLEVLFVCALVELFVLVVVAVLLLVFFLTCSGVLSVAGVFCT